ncbi:hypothetical protein IAD21_01069 [Abditibacteriota bacterium]|nr:hypothetical protein IAD21_01069 [Abditibacteriota bacterium]
MADMTPQGTQAYSVESGYERGDANVRGVVQGLAIVFAGTFVVMAAMFGMFNFLNKRLILEENRTPVALTREIVPPEPRLLPSPHTDEEPEAENVAKAEAKSLGENPAQTADSVARTTADGLPWDKRNLEIVDQYDEANSYGKNADGTQRIPIKEAMQKQAGVTEGGSPAVMTWQPEHPRLVAGEDGKGAINLELGTKEKPDTKQQDYRIFDLRPSWESPDEKFTVLSSGGTSLKAGELSR